MTDLEAHVNAKGRKRTREAGAGEDQRARDPVHLLPVRLGHRAYRRQGHARRIIGSASPRRASSSSMARPPICLSTATRTTSATGRRPRSWSAFPTPRPSCNCPGTSGSRASSAPASAIARKRSTRGGHLTSDCRGNLRIIHEEFKKTHKGLHLRHGCEPEMMWLKKGEDGLPDGGFSKPNCYHIDQFESLRPVFMRAIEYSPRHGPGHDPGRP